MKKINYKKEYLREFNYRCDMQDKIDNYRKKYLIWQSLGIFGLILIFGILGSMLIISITNSSDYMATKTECKNVTIIEDVPIPLHLLCAFKDAKDLDCMKNMMEACERFGGELWKDENFTFTGYCIMKDVEQQREECVSQEVSEITLNYDNQVHCEISTKYCDSKIPYPVVVTVNGSSIDSISMQGCKNNCWKTDVLSTTVQMKDVKKEWLDNNCECIKWCDYELYRKPLCFNSIEESWSDRDNIDNLICSKYICGDYEVLKND